MSQTSASMASRRAVRVAVAAVVAVALLAPATFLFTRVRDASTATLDFHRAERAGVAYLGPLIELLGVVAQAQNAAVRGEPVDAAAVRAAVGEVDVVDGRHGGQLRSNQRWAEIRGTVENRISRGWPDKDAAYQQFSDLTTTLLELTAKVADVSKLVLDPQLDSHYLTVAAAQRIPGIIVDSGRYLDLVVISGNSGQAETQARLITARDRIATDSAELYDGLLRAFAANGTSTLAPGLTPLLDGFRTAVAEVAPATSLLAPAPRRTAEGLEGNQATLQRATLTLHGAALTELDRLLQPRESAAYRTGLFSLIAFVLIAVVVVGAAVAFVLLLPDADAEPDDEDEPVAAGRELVGTGPPGGARAAR